MNLRPRIIIIMAAVALAVIAGIWLLTMERKDSTAEKMDVVGISDPDSLQSVMIGNDSGHYTVAQEDGVYTVEGLENERINTGLAQNLFVGLASLKSMAVSHEDEQTTGLNDPVATATLHTIQGDIVLSVGRKSADYDGYYMVRHDTGGIFIVNSYMAEMLMYGINEYRNSQFLDYSYEEDYAYLKSLRVAGKEIIGVAVESTDGDFIMTQPVTYPCVFRDLKVALLDGVMHLKGNKYVGSSADEQMGFGDPDYTIELTYKNEDIIMLIGSEIGESRYVKREDKDDIYLVPVDELSFLGIDYRQAIGSVLYTRDISDVERITASTQGKEFVFDVHQEKSGTTVSFGGKTYEWSSFLPLYNRINGLTLFKRVDEGTADNLGELNIKLALKDGKSDELKLTKINKREYSVSLNGYCVFTTPATVVEEILERLNSF